MSRKCRWPLFLDAREPRHEHVFVLRSIKKSNVTEMSFALVSCCKRAMPRICLVVEEHQEELCHANVVCPCFLLQESHTTIMCFVEDHQEELCHGHVVCPCFLVSHAGPLSNGRLISITCCRSSGSHTSTPSTQCRARRRVPPPTTKETST